MDLHNLRRIDTRNCSRIVVDNFVVHCLLCNVLLFPWLSQITFWGKDISVLGSCIQEAGRREETKRETLCRPSGPGRCCNTCSQRGEGCMRRGNGMGTTGGCSKQVWVSAVVFGVCLWASARDSRNEGRYAGLISTSQAGPRAAPQ